MFRRILWNAGVLFALFLCSCANGGRTANDSAFPDAARRLRDAIPVREAAVSDPAVDFVAITDLVTDARGYIYAADFYSKRITVFDPNGRVQSVFGRAGDGPGEFRLIRNLQILPGDSLLVYDSGPNRITVYPPDAREPAYVTNIGAQINGNPHQVFRTPSNDGYLALFQEVAGTDLDRVRKGDVIDRLALYDLSGVPLVDTLVLAPSREMVRVKVGDNGYVTPHPFGRRLLFQLGSTERLFYLWTGDPTVRTIALADRDSASFTFEYEPPTVTGHDRDAFVANVPLPWAREAVRSALEESGRRRWPVADAMYVDDEGRVWMRLAGAEPKEWVVFDRQGAYLASLILPTNTTVQAVRGRNIIATAMNEQDVAYVSILEMGRDLPAIRRGVAAGPN